MRRTPRCTRHRRSPAVITTLAVLFFGLGLAAAPVAAVANLLCEAVFVETVDKHNWNARQSGNVMLDHLLGANVHRLGSNEDPYAYIGQLMENLLANNGISTKASREANNLLTRLETIFLDPEYSAKAMATLIDHFKQGKFNKQQNVVFPHTDGTPGLFAYADELVPAQLSEG